MSKSGSRTANAKKNQLRIIAGQWRGRKLIFPDLPGLRPTSDRIRETLFNWLQNDIVNARCLDLYAGSGALGIEALSRRADSVVFVDTVLPITKQLQHNFDELKDTRGIIRRMDALSFIKMDDEAFDIIFIDPPFELGLVDKTIDALQQSTCLKKHTLIYVECEKRHDVTAPDNWRSLKEKRTGQVKYMLFEIV